jgi:hypothetical protein
MMLVANTPSGPGGIARVDGFSDGRNRRAHSDPWQLLPVLPCPAVGLARVLSTKSIDQAGPGRRPTERQPRGGCGSVLVVEVGKNLLDYDRIVYAGDEVAGMH